MQISGWAYPVRDSGSTHTPELEGSASASAADDRSLLVGRGASASADEADGSAASPLAGTPCTSIIRLCTRHVHSKPLMSVLVDVSEVLVGQ